MTTIPALGPGNHNQKITIAEGQRSFLVHVPPGYNASTHSPLVLAFHGGTGTPRAMMKLTGMNACADKHNFVVVYPEGQQRHWNDGRDLPDIKQMDDVAFVKEMLEYLSDELNIDRQRIYTTGVSNGGFFSQRLIYELPEIAAAASVVAARTTWMVNNADDGQAPHPVAFILGTQDPLVPFKGGPIGFPRQKGTRGAVLSAEDTIQFWVTINKCRTPPTTQLLPKKDRRDGTQTELSIYRGAGGNDVYFYKIEAGGHTWPGGWQYLPESIIGKTSHDFDASEAIWNFFAAHPKTN